MHGPLRPLLEPSTIAVIGASQNETKPGSQIVRNLVEGQFPGRIYPVNPRGGSLVGLDVYRHVQDVPVRVDLAFVVVRRELVREAVVACGRAGTRALVLVTAGFAEADDWGAAEQQEIAQIIRSHDMVAIGPNTIGLVTMGGRLRGSFVRFPTWESGPVALCAQSGVFAGAVADDQMAQPTNRLGIHASVGIGNRIAVRETDFLEAFKADPQVGVMGFYLEHITEPRAFLACAADVKRSKPVVVLKSGRTSAGRAAARSHTGAVSPDDAVFQQLLTQHGLVRATDDADLMALLTGFSRSPVPRGPRLGIVTFSGALGVIASDLAADAGLELSEFEGHTRASIAAVLPNWQGVRNPADLWPAVERDRRDAFVVGLRSSMADPRVDQVLAILLAVPNADFATLREDLGTLRADLPDKPLHLVVRGSLREEWKAATEDLSVVTHPSLQEAVRVLSALTWYGQARSRYPSAHLD